MVNVPNIVTVMRGFLIPVFITLLLYKHFLAATVIFLIAALTDALDGFLARKLKQITTFGVILDPIVDKLLIDSSFLTLSYVDKIIPIWLTVIVISRDIFLITGGWLLSIFGKVDRIKPNLLGKLTAFSQFFTVFVTLINLNFKLNETFLNFTYLTAGVLTVASAISYAFKGIKDINNEEIL